MYVVARARSEKTRLTGKCRRLAQISPSNRDAGLYSCDGFVDKKGGVDGGELVAADSPAIQRQWFEAGLGRIIEHDVISAQLSVQI